MKKQKLFSPVFVVAIAIVLAGLGFMALGNNGGQALFGLSLPWSKSPKLSLQNLTEPSRNSNFWVGDRYSLTATTKPNKPVKMCWAMRNKGELQSKGCNDASQNPPTSLDGKWSYEETLVGISVGNWQRWIEVDGVASNKVEQSVRWPKPPVTVVSPNGGENWKVGQKVKIRWKTTNVDKNVLTQLDIMDDRISDWIANSLFGASPVLKYATLISSDKSGNTYEYDFTVPKNFNFSLPPQYQNIFGGNHYKVNVIIVVGGEAGTPTQQTESDTSDSTFSIVAKK